MDLSAILPHATVFSSALYLVLLLPMSVIVGNRRAVRAVLWTAVVTYCTLFAMTLILLGDVHGLDFIWDIFN